MARSQGPRTKKSPICWPGQVEALREEQARQVYRARLSEQGIIDDLPDKAEVLLEAKRRRQSTDQCQQSRKQR